MSAQTTYIALLRGINVGGHHKVPMAELKDLLKNQGYSNIVTLLNSGNVIFQANKQDCSSLELKLASLLEKHFGFAIPTLLRTTKELQDILSSKAFNNIEVTKDIRLYVSFIKHTPDKHIDLPWVSKDESYRIVDFKNRAIFSYLDVSKTPTPKAMGILESYYGKDITTRNWNTINKIASKL